MKNLFPSSAKKVPKPFNLSEILSRVINKFHAESLNYFKFNVEGVNFIFYNFCNLLRNISQYYVAKTSRKSKNKKLSKLLRFSYHVSLFSYLSEQK